MSEPDGPERTARLVRAFFGLILMAGGGLIILLGGACTLYLTFGSGAPPRGLADILIAVVFALGVGAIPVGIGWAMIIAGRGLYAVNAGAPTTTPDQDDDL